MSGKSSTRGGFEKFVQNISRDNLKEWHPRRSGSQWEENTNADSVQQPHVQQPSTYAKPEAASAVLGSSWWAVCRPKRVELHINMD